MKEYRTEQQLVKKEVLVKHVCDICGTDMRKKEVGDASEVTIEAKIGNVWPEGDFREKYSIDVCASCFEDHLKPLIESQYALKFKEESL